MTFTSALPTFLVTLREGFEAALVVGIVLAALARSGQQQFQRWAYGGIFAGLLASVLFGFGLETLLQTLQIAYPSVAPILQPALKALIGVVAVILLSWMLLWMTQQSRTLKAEVEAAVDASLQQDSATAWGVFAIVATAVLREGMETVLFVATQFQEGAGSVLGAIAGILTAVLMGILLFQWGIRINIRLFFQTMGVLLLLIVGGLLISVLKNVDAAALAYAKANPAISLCIAATLATPSRSCILGPLVWDASHVLSDRQFPGVVLKTLVGYRDRLYTLQLVSYLIFWLTMGRAYLRTLLPNLSTSIAKAATEPSGS